MTSIRKGFKSTSAAAILGLSTIVGVTAAPALAPIAVAQQVAPQPSNIDPAAKGSIVIHKRSGDEGAQRDNGNVNDSAPGQPLDGVTFRAQRVTDVDLTTNQGFAEASQLTAATAASRQLEDKGTQITSSGGTATFSDLPVGVYLVTEESAPEGYAPGAPFLVFIPMTDPTNTAKWNYNVNVYPKNSELNATKEIADADKNVGDDVTFTITTDVPAPVEGGTISKYIVTDQLQADRVSTQDSKVQVALKNGGDVSLAPSDYSIEVSGDQLVTVTFSESGRQKLSQAKRANPKVQVVTTIGATVKEVGSTDGHLRNTATVVSNRGGGSSDVTKPTNEVNAYWGKLKIVKQGDQSAPLYDATFEVYRCQDKGSLGEKISINSKDTWTTTNDGTVTIDGIHVTDFADDKIVDQPGKLCLVETKAPQGYELLPEPVEVEFTREALQNTQDQTDAYTQAAVVTNVKSNGPKLPLTGGAGIGLLALLGAALVGAGAWWAKRNSSKA